MSGGSWDYVYERVAGAAESLRHSEEPSRRALGRQLVKFAKALHDIEWVDSCDYGKGDEEPAIMAALGVNAAALVLSEVVEKAVAAREDLDKAIKLAEPKP